MEMSFVNSCRHLLILIISINTKLCHHLIFIPKTKSQREVKKKKNVREREKKETFFYFLRKFFTGIWDWVERKLFREFGYFLIL